MSSHRQSVAQVPQSRQLVQWKRKANSNIRKSQNFVTLKKRKENKWCYHIGIRGRKKNEHRFYRQPNRWPSKVEGTSGICFELGKGVWVKSWWMGWRKFRIKKEGKGDKKQEKIPTICCVTGNVSLFFFRKDRSARRCSSSRSPMFVVVAVAAVVVVVVLVVVVSVVVEKVTVVVAVSLLCWLFLISGVFACCFFPSGVVGWLIGKWISRWRLR